MKKENFKRAKEIERDISLLRENIEDVRLRAFGKNGEIKDFLGVEIIAASTQRPCLIPSLVVPLLEEFITFYLSRAEQRIKELEKEFEEL